MKTSPTSSTPHRSYRKGLLRWKPLLLLAALCLVSVSAYLKTRSCPHIGHKKSGARTDIGNLCGFILSYKEQHGEKWPESLAALKQSGDITEAMTKDPWGNDYVMVVPGTRSKEGFDLYSYGPDGVEGCGDDIGNWESE